MDIFSQATFLNFYSTWRYEFTKGLSNSFILWLYTYYIPLQVASTNPKTILTSNQVHQKMQLLSLEEESSVSILCIPLDLKAYLDM